MPELNTAIIVVLGYAGLEAVKWGVQRFFKRTVETDYKTVAACKLCRVECETAREKRDNETSRELALIRGVLLVVAVNSGVSPEQLKDLTQ